MIKLLQYAVFIVPWFSLLLTSKENRKRYIPVTILSCFIMTIIFQIAYTYEWWEIEKYILPWGYMMDAGFVYGIFAVGTFWIFRFTSDKFLLFICINVIMDGIMTFIILPLLGKLHIAHYVHIHAWQYFLVIFGVSFLLYGYHLWQKEIYQNDKN